MATPQRNAEKLSKEEDSHMKHNNNCLKSSESPLVEMLRSRIDEQSSLICVLKHRADEMLLRSEARQKINAELEVQLAHIQNELDMERKRADLLEKRFADLAANNQGIISFMEEHKSQNALLKLENKQLQSENDSLFSQKLHDREVLIQKLTQEIKLLHEKCINQEKEYRTKLTGCESKLREQDLQHKAKETSLLSQLQDTQQKHKDATEMCKELKQKLEDAKEQHASKEINMKESIADLTKEKNKLLSLSMERGKVIQEKQVEIQQLETKWREEKKARTMAVDRFEMEAEAVNANERVKSLQAALSESMKSFQQLTQDFDAYKEHNATLLTQERDLNKKLRHMVG